MKHCPACGREVDERLMNCPACGGRWEADGTFTATPSGTSVSAPAVADQPSRLRRRRLTIIVAMMAFDVALGIALAIFFLSR